MCFVFTLFSICGYCSGNFVLLSEVREDCIFFYIKTLILWSYYIRYTSISQDSFKMEDSREVQLSKIFFCLITEKICNLKCVYNFLPVAFFCVIAIF